MRGQVVSSGGAGGLLVDAERPEFALCHPAQHRRREQEASDREH
jgi:hypothetical protein